MPNCASYLEAEDDGPDEAQREAVVSVHDVVGAHVLQVDPLLLQELQSLVHVLQAVDPHPALGGFGLKPKHIAVYLQASETRNRERLPAARRARRRRRKQLWTQLNAFRAALCYDSVLKRVKVFSYAVFIITLSLIKRSAGYKHPGNRKHVFISSEKQPLFSTNSSRASGASTTQITEDGTLLTYSAF